MYLCQHASHVLSRLHVATDFDEPISGGPVRDQPGHPSGVTRGHFSLGKQLVRSDLDFAQQGDQHNKPTVIRWGPYLMDAYATTL